MAIGPTFSLAPEPEQGINALFREALVGAGSTVWEWSPISDTLSGMDGPVCLLGYAPGEVPWNQEAWNGLIHPDDLSANEQAFLRHAAGETLAYEHEYRVRAKDGRWRWMVERGRIVARAADGQPLRVVGTMTDVHSRRHAELSALAAHELAATAEAANRAKSSFLSRMSHELRTPLNAVLGFAQLLEMDPSEPLSATQQQRVTLIREAGDHLLQMITELLDLTRIESGKLDLALTDVALAPLVSECLDMLRPAAGAAGVTLQPAPPDELPPASPGVVRADATRLKQVVLNLLSNAVKYNRPGGTVWVSLSTAGAICVLQVHDNGVGITPADQAQLFQPFNRLAHRGSAIEGTGIGLAVTHGLVQLMGGHITVQSTPGVGSCFGVALPRP